MLQPWPFPGRPLGQGQSLAGHSCHLAQGCREKGSHTWFLEKFAVRQLSGQGLVTVHVNGRAPAAHVEHQGYKWNAAC